MYMEVSSLVFYAQSNQCGYTRAKNMEVLHLDGSVTHKNTQNQCTWRC